MIIRELLQITAILMVLLITGGNTKLNAQNDNRQLFLKGDAYFFRQNLPDSAMLCYDKIVQDYNEQMSAADKLTCIDALLGKWRVYFNTYNDYRGAFDCLYTALDISKQIGRKVPTIYQDLANTYFDLGIQISDSSMSQTALDYYKQAFNIAIGQKNWTIADHCFVNIVSITDLSGNIKLAEKQWEVLRVLHDNNPASFHHATCLYYLAHVAESKGRHNEAINYCRQIINDLPDNLEFSRMRYMSYMKIANIYYSLQDYNQALRNVKSLNKIIDKYHLTDARLQVYNNLANIYERMGMESKADWYRMRFYQMKDTLLNYRQLKAVQGYHFIKEMDDANNKIRDMREQHKIERRIFICIGIASLLIIIVLVLLYIKSKQLQQKNLILYQRARSMISLPFETSNNEDEQPSSEIDKVEKDRIEDSVRRVISDEDIICDANFNARRLAELIGSRQSIVSQILRERFNCNFRTLLNDCRIKIAIQRMSENEDYANYTIEGIAQSVGIKSRTTFVESFKRATGLTPSEYMHIAKSAHKH